VKRQGFTTEDFVAAILKDIRKEHAIDPERNFTLCWSSGGPAAYALSHSNSDIRGSFVAMSVFVPKKLPALKNAKGHAYYIFLSPKDHKCAHEFAKEASEVLPKHGAQATLVEYADGHTWPMPPFPPIKAGISWLEKHARAPKPDKR
jgi:predicted esterase